MRMVMTFRAYSLKFSAGAAILLSLYGPHSYAAPDITSQLTRSSIDTSYQSCKTLIHCTDILDRHDPDSFDYSVLAVDFDRFGEKGRAILWRKIEAGKNGDAEAEALANRALDILSRSPKILPPAEQRRIAEMWQRDAGAPYRPDLLARIMMTNLSPMVRSTAIQTLNHPHAEITYYSRVILAQTLKRNMSFPMPKADLAPLRRAALDTASPVLSRLIALYPRETSAPILAQILKSGETPAVIAAYAALYESDAEAAFKALVSTLYALKPEDAKAATGLGGLLAHRHPLRDDGFYMSFASDLLNDPEMSLSGRAAGFDALLRRQGEKKVPDLPNTPLSRAAFAQALLAFSDRPTPAPYYTLPLRMDPKQADIWLQPLRRAASTSEDKIALVETAGRFDTALARTIAAEAAAARGDYRQTVAGILAQTAQARPNERVLTRNLTAVVRNHPFNAVAAAAALGLEALEESSPRKAIMKLQPRLARRAAKIAPRSAFCKIDSTNLRAKARAMPFYEPAVLPDHSLAKRSWLTTGARASEGWLAGYSRPGSGGLVRYDNVSGDGRELFGNSVFGPQAVIAVHPTRRVPLGQTATRFWIFATALETGQSAIYLAQQSTGNAFTLTRHETLPAQPTAIKLNGNGDITFAMGGVNPPLTLSENGALKRACNDKARTEKTPS